MGLGHEKLDVYRAAIEYVGWAYRYCEMLKGHRNAKDQLGQRGYVVTFGSTEVGAGFSLSPFGKIQNGTP